MRHSNNNDIVAASHCLQMAAATATAAKGDRDSDSGNDQ